MTNKRLQEIQDYLNSRREFWWKDLPTETYIEHVDELIEEVLALRKKVDELDKPSPAMTLLRSIYGDSAMIKTWSREDIEAFRDRMDKITNNRERPGLLPNPTYPRLPRKRE